MIDARATWLSRLDDWTATALARPRVWFAAAAVFCAIQIGPWWYATPDSTSYMSIARSMWEPGGPTNLGRQQLYFSIGYPLLIAPTFLLDDRPFAWIAGIHWLLTLALMAGVYRWARPFGSTAALVATIVTVVHALYGNSVRRPLSETFFMTAMVWAAIVLDQVRTADAGRRRIVAAIGGTLLLTLACLIRPNGVAIIPGFGLAMIAAAWGDRRQLISALIVSAVIGGFAGCVFIVARQIDDARATDEESFTYWDQLVSLQDPSKSMLGRVPDGLQIQMYDFQRVIVPGTFKSRNKESAFLNVNFPIALATTVLVGFGWWQAMRTRGDVWTWTFPFYIGLNMLWAADTGTRYTIPVMPIVLATSWLGLTHFWPVASRWIVLFMLLHAGTGLGYWAAIDLPRTRERNQHWGSVERLTAKVDRDRDTLGAWSLSPEQLQFFRFVLDRNVLPYSIDPVPPVGGPQVATTVPADRIFSLANIAPPPGYEKVADDGPYALLRRVK